MFRLIQESPQGFDFLGSQCLQQAIDGEIGRGVAVRWTTVVGIGRRVGMGVATMTVRWPVVGVWLNIK